MNKKFLLSFLVFILTALLFSGCASYTELSQRAIVKAVGVDYENGIYSVSIQYFSPTKEGGISQIDKTQSNVLLSVGEGKSLFEAIENASFKTGKDMLFGQNRIIIIGKAACLKPLSETLRFFTTGSRCHPSAHPVVTDGKAEDIIAIKFKEGDVSSTKLVNMLENAAADGRTFAPSIYNVIKNLEGSTKSALLPLLSVTEEKTDVTVTEQGEGGDKSGDKKEKTAALTGCAIFNKNDCRIISSDAAIAASLLIGRAATCPVSFDADDSGRSSVTLFKILPDIYARYENEKLSFYITFNAAARSEQLSSNNISEEKIADSAADVIKRLINKALDDTVRADGADIFELETVLRHYRPDIWLQNQNDMQALLSSADFHIGVTIRPYSKGQRTG